MNRSSYKIRHPQARRRLFRGLSPAGIVILAALNLSAGTTYDASKHGHPETGILRLADAGTGSCAQCHDNHGSRMGISNGGPFGSLLFTTDDETLCYSCHSEESSSNVYPGNAIWADSTHSTSSMAFWPGPTPVARPPADAGKCVNCHDPHGTDDADGIVPSMLRLREQMLCMGCHDGSPGKDVAAQFIKSHKHPVASIGRHTAAEGIMDAPAQYDDSDIPRRRHAECADCHNAHVAAADTIPAQAPEASRRLYGVSRISVVNGPAGTTPAYGWRGASDLFDPREYEICFKCHSSWTELPAGSADLARLTNPNNPSYHPVQAAGKNRNVDPAAFEDGMDADAQIYCSSCHGSDDPLVRGPHGSSNQNLLVRPYGISPNLRTMTPAELCFSCHRFTVYADALSTGPIQQASRFNQPASQGHAYHVGAQQVACATCHVAHGSATQPSLIATGQTPGIVIYNQNAGGGSCTPTCHTTRSWSVNYGR
jgi:predicted CXXCH cytochrome family protein